MITYRKIGGLHWLFIGRIRIAWCVRGVDNPNVRAKRAMSRPLPVAPQLADVGSCYEPNEYRPADYYDWIDNGKYNPRS